MKPKIMYEREKLQYKYAFLSSLFIKKPIRIMDKNKKVISMHPTSNFDPWTVPTETVFGKWFMENQPDNLIKYRVYSNIRVIPKEWFVFVAQQANLGICSLKTWLNKKIGEDFIDFAVVKNNKTYIKTRVNFSKEVIDRLGGGIIIVSP